MSREAGSIDERATAGPHAIRRVGSRPGRDSWYGADVLVASVGLIMLVEHLRCRARYATCPMLAMIPPAALAASSPAYRRRVRDWFGTLWARVEAYSAGRGRTPWLAAIVLVALPTWLLDLSNQRTRGADDTKPVVPTAVSLITQGDWELGEYFAPGARLSLRDGEGQIRQCFRPGRGGIYSSYPAGMVPFAMATSGLAALLDANLLDEQVQLRLQKVTAAAVGAACVGLFFLIALSLAPPRAAWVTAAILAAGSGMFSTVGMALWQHGGVIFWSSIALLIEFGTSGRPTRRGAAIQGVCCGLMVTCRLTSVSWLVPFGAWVLVRDPRRAAVIAGAAALAFAPWAWCYATTYGAPLGPSTSFLSGGLWSSDVAMPLLGVLISPARGLLVYQPWIALGLLAALPWSRSIRAGRDEPPGWSGFCLAAIAAHLLLISVWGCWWGGWCWGSRLVVEAVPLAALLVVRPIAALWDLRWGRAVVIGLGLLGLAAQCPGVYLDPAPWNARARMPEDLWSWSRAPFFGRWAE